MAELPASLQDRDTAKSVAASVDDGAPAHVAIIMDGNHRWAKARTLPGAAGHRAGAKNVRRIAEACADQGVACLTLFAFSTENWQRPRREVSLLMDLMRSVLKNDLDELHAREVRLRVIGDRTRFAPDLQLQMNQAEALTRENARMTLNIAANYGGRWDILAATKRIAREFRDGELDLNELDEERFAQYLSLADVPPPDLCIRTGGDCRISNFLLWDFAYTELLFTESFWPDFDPEALLEALKEYIERQRRFGRRP
ncbi:MAG: polyprenyl diphosphate synthase [Pseudomonadales bacterium]